MSRPNIVSRLSRGERLLLDGATGSELQRRGLNLTQGTRSPYETGPWSATAMRDAPEVVRAIHEDYLRVGADIVTCNSFWTNRPMLEMVGLADEMESFSRLAVELARDARDRFNPDAYVAGSMSPPRYGDLAKEFADQARVLADAGADLLLLELVGSIEEAVTAVRAVADAGLPVLLGIYITERCTMQTGVHDDTGESLAALIERLDGARVDAILPMCVSPDWVSAGLRRLREAYDGPLGGYANLGYVHTRKAMSYPTRQFHNILVDHTPEQLAECARDWLAAGAQIVGGCCGSTPEHIAALRPVVG